MKKTKKKTVKKTKKKELAKDGVFKFNRVNIKCCDIDFDQVYTLGTFQSTKEEVYSVLRINKTELFRDDNQEWLEKFNEAYFAGKQAGQNELRKTQLKQAKKFPAMSIFLGKQYLGQSDNPNQLASSDLGTLKVEFVNSKEESQEERIKRIESSLNDELK